MLGARIALLRRESGWSQKELAGHLEISPSAVGMYEQGRREPSGQQIVQLARLFGVSTDYLLTGCAAQPCDIESLRRIVSFAQKKLDKTLLLRGQDGTLRAVTDEDLAALLAALLA